MKTSLSTIILAATTSIAFICSYFLELTMDNIDQYLAVIGVVFVDGFFGIIAGVKREGFKTYKAIKVLKTAITWIIILTMTLMIERGFTGTGWMSETVLIPFLVFQVISALKNASMAGFIKMEELNKVLDKIDNHKGIRN